MTLVDQAEKKVSGITLAFNSPCNNAVSLYVFLHCFIFNNDPSVILSTLQRKRKKMDYEASETEHHW